MASDEPRDDRCGANVKQGDGYCERYIMNHGRCYLHGGATPEGTDTPEGNTNAMTHGLYAQRTNYYQSLDEDEQAFVEAIVDGWLDQAPFGRDNQAKVNRLFKIAVDEHKLWRANDYYDEEDLVVEDFERGEDGEVHKTREEHPVNLAYDRLSRTTVKELKELGALSDPDSQQAEATKSLAKQLSGLTDDNE